MPSTVRRRDRPDRLPSFAAMARVAGVLAAGLIRDDLQAHLALARVGERPPSPTPTSLPVRTISDSAAFARASAIALEGEGRAAGIARASVVGVELHMHRDVAGCWIGHDELTAVLLLRQQSGHAAQPVPRSWNGRGPLVSPRAADGCIAPMMRKPIRATPTSPAAPLLP
jgi:hypothetical protein